MKASDLTHRWEDIGFAAVAKAEEHRVEFKVWKFAGDDLEVYLADGDGNVDVLLDGDEEEPTPFLSGGVKWDGCSNWTLDGLVKDRLYIHFCRSAQGEAIGILFRRLYEAAAKLMPAADWLEDRDWLESRNAASPAAA